MQTLVNKRFQLAPDFSDVETVAECEFDRTTFTEKSDFNLLAISRSVFRQCEFVGVDFKHTQFLDTIVVDCRFLNCRFNGTEILNSRFHNTKFFLCKHKNTIVADSLQSKTK